MESLCQLENQRDKNLNSVFSINQGDSCEWLYSPEIFISPEKFDEIAPHELTIIASGSQGEFRSAVTKIAMLQHPNVRLMPEDTAIISARIIPGNETKIAKIANAFVRQGVTVYTAEDDGIHASGHAYQDELKRLIKITWSLMVPEFLMIKIKL